MKSFIRVTPKKIGIIAVIVTVALIGISIFTKYFNQRTSRPFSFLVAGHAYGRHQDDNPGIYPPFKKKLLRLNQKVDFGFFLGDSIRDSNELSWNALSEDLKDIGFKVYLAAGNHDVEMIKKMIGPGYSARLHQGSLFVVLNSELGNPPCNITGAQLEFLKEELEKYQGRPDNIFIFMHRTIWANNKNQFSLLKSVMPNSF